MNHILLMEGEMIRVMAYCTEVGNDSNHIRKEEENPFKRRNNPFDDLS